MPKLGLRGFRDVVAAVTIGSCLLQATANHLIDTRALDWFRETSDRMRMLGSVAEKLRRMGISGEEIGYLNRATPRAGAEFYFGLQYQMLPSILLESAVPRFQIVQTNDRSQLSAIAKANHCLLVGDAGNGFYLLRQEQLTEEAR